jgi:preprotein translocase subunit SecF
MEFFKHNTQIDFMAQRKWAAIASVILFSLSILSLMMNGLTWGLDFTGGTQIQLHFAEAANVTQVRDDLQAAGFKNAEAKSYGTSQDVLVSLVPKKDAATTENKASNATSVDATKDALVSDVQKIFPTAKIQQVDYIGPQVGQELATKGALAIVIALLGTMIYIALRFEVRFAVGSTLALVHDTYRI